MWKFLSLFTASLPSQAMWKFHCMLLFGLGAIIAAASEECKASQPAHERTRKAESYLQVSKHTAVKRLPSVPVAPEADRPHIVVAMVDDLGYSGVGFNLAEEQKADPTQIPRTPVIDGLAQSGVILKRHYTATVCSPSRASFMSGRFPGNVNVHNPVLGRSGTSIDTGMSTIADMLHGQGYATHHVGKWHLGMSRREYLPVNRGFDTSLAMLGGSAHYFDGSQDAGAVRDFWYNDGPSELVTKFKVKDNEEGCVEYKQMLITKPWLDEKTGCKPYAHDIYMQQTKKLIASHDINTPFFLFLSLQLTHVPLQVPVEFLNEYSNEIWISRRYAHGMVSALDKAMKDLHGALVDKGMWNKTLLLFTSDNGGPRDHGSNYPFRGSKGSDFEGGVRAASFVAGGWLPAEVHGTSLSGMIHLCDWWATFAGLAGVPSPSKMKDPKSIGDRSIPEKRKFVDSLDVWPYISGQVPESPRTMVWLGMHALISKNGKFKLMRGHFRSSEIPGPTTPNETDEVLLRGTSRLDVDESRVLQESILDGLASPLDCGAGPPGKAGCLFDLESDEREINDKAEDRAFAGVMQEMIAELTELESGAHQSNLGFERWDEMYKAATDYGNVFGPYEDDLPTGVITGFEINGNNLGQNIMGVKSIAACADLCAEASECVAWHYSENRNNSDSVCARFSKVNQSPDDIKVALHTAAWIKPWVS